MPVPDKISPYEQTLIEVRIDKIKQKLFWYDNLPEDSDIVAYVKEWHDLNKKLRDAGIDSI